MYNGRCVGVYQPQCTRPPLSATAVSTPYVYACDTSRSPAATQGLCGMAAARGSGGGRAHQALMPFSLAHFFMTRARYSTCGLRVDLSMASTSRSTSLRSLRAIT